MKIGAYSFTVSGDTEQDLFFVRQAVSPAAAAGVRLLALPEHAPAGLFDRSGKLCASVPRNREGLMTCDLDITPPDFGEEGRKALSDRLAF